MAELKKAVQINVGKESAQIQYSEEFPEYIIQRTIAELIRLYNSEFVDNLDYNVYKLASFKIITPNPAARDLVTKVVAGESYDA